MPLLEFVTGVIADVSLQAAREHLSRREAVIRALKKAGLDPQPKREDFEAIYKHTLIEWGVFKPKELLDFYRDETVYRAFLSAFNANDPAILTREIEEARQRYEEQGYFRRLETDPRREIAAFTTIFNEIVDRTRAPAETRRDHKLESLDDKIEQILKWTRESATTAELRVLERDGYILVGDFSQAIINIQSRLEGVEQSVGSKVSPAARREQLLPYLEMTARRSGRLLLGALDPKGRDSAQINLSRVFINVDAGTTSRVDVTAEPSTGCAYSAAIAHIHHNPQVILRGDPGSGKSTLLRFLSFCLANAWTDPAVKWLEELQWIEAHWTETGQTDQPPIDEEGLRQLVESEGTSSVSISAERVSVTRRPVRQRAGRGDDREAVKCYWQDAAPIPITIELRDFAKSDFDPDSSVAIWNYVSELLRPDGLEDIEPALREEARRGRVMFLLDGVDEVPPDKRPLVWQAIDALRDGPYGGCRWVATCRILSFVAEEAPAGVPVPTLATLSDEQIEWFIEKWYEALAEVGEATPVEAAGYTRGLKSAAAGPDLRKLARNPMLLTLMAIVQTYYGTLPDERVKLYQQCVHTLLLRWQRHKEESGSELPRPLAELGVKQDDLERLLWEIGWEAHSHAAKREDAADIPEMDVIRLARKHFGGSLEKAEKFITYTEQRAHLLLGRGGVDERVYAFPHRTFQEYLAACHLAGQRRLGRRAAALAATPDQWREVLNLTAGELVFNRKSGNTLIDALDEMLPEHLPEDDDEAGWLAVWQAGEMATTVGGKGLAGDPDTGAALLPRLLVALVLLLERGCLTSVQRAAAGLALGRLGDPRPEAVDVDAMQFCFVPRGPFVMGSRQGEPDARDNESGHTDPVDLPYDYWLARFPITNGQFEAFIADEGYKTARYWPEAESAQRWRAPGQVKGWTGDWRDRPYEWDETAALGNHPRTGITWFEALAFGRWLTERWRAAGRLPDGWEVRLASEAEWEKAARGGLTVPVEPLIKAIGDLLVAPAVALVEQPAPRRFPWGDEPPEGRANYDKSGIGRPSAAGCFPAGRGPYGHEDLAGNVWEWTRTKYADYPYDAGDGREKPDGASGRVIRGGAYYREASSLRGAYRNWNLPDLVIRNYGARLAVSPVLHL